MVRQRERSPRRRLLPDQRRLELLDAGERTIRRLGRDARVEDVVIAANASKGTFYVYFETWEHFLLELRDLVFRQLDASFERHRLSCTDWVALVGGLPTLFIDLTLSLEGLHAAVFHGPVSHVRIRNPRLDVKSRLAELIRDGIEQGALEAPDVGATSRFVFALLHQAADLVEAGHDRQEIASTLERLLLNALRVRPVRLSDPAS